MITILDSIKLFADSKICFVCEKQTLSKSITYHPKIHLPVCDTCRGSEQEEAKVEELLEGLAEDFVCGCI